LKSKAKTWCQEQSKDLMSFTSTKRARSS
jgi:hypothetical protein